MVTRVSARARIDGASVLLGSNWPVIVNGGCVDGNKG